MEVTINLDATQLGDKIEKIFDSLTPDQTEKIAVQVLTKFLEEPTYAERKIFSDKLVTNIRNTESYHKHHNDDEIRNSYKHTEGMKAFKSTKEKMVEKITNTAMTHFVKKVDELVEADVELKQIFEANKAEIKESFPQFIQAAMTTWFVKGMSEMQTMMHAAYSQSSYAKDATDRIVKYLENNGHRM